MRDQRGGHDGFGGRTGEVERELRRTSARHERRRARQLERCIARELPNDRAAVGAGDVEITGIGNCDFEVARPGAGNDIREIQKRAASRAQLWIVWPPPAPVALALESPLAEVEWAEVPPPTPRVVDLFPVAAAARWASNDTTGDGGAE